MFVSSNSSYLKTSTRRLVLKVLRDSGVFEHTWKELELWLDHLARLDQSQQETVIQFLDHVLMRVVCNPHVYTEKAASMVQEAANIQANLSGQDGDEASIPISHIEDVLDMVDVIVEGSEGDVEEIGPSLTEDIILQTFPFSAIVPAVLEARNKLPASFKDAKGVLYEYMAAVLCDVLHCQRDPLALCLTLLHYDEELNTSSSLTHASVISFYHYYSQWLPKTMQETLVITEDFTDVCSRVGVTALLKASFTNGAKAFLQDSFKEAVQEALASLEVSQFPVAVNQVLLYLRNYVVNFKKLPKETAAEVLRSLMSVLNSLIFKLLSLETQQPTQLEPAEQQDEENLFLDMPAENTDKDQIVLAVLRSVFKHPAVEQWFLALELCSFPPHQLNPVRLKQLCTCLTELTIILLESSAATLRELEALELISTYLTAAQRAVLKELQEQKSNCPKKESLCVRALLALQDYIDPSSLKEVVSTLLLLPQEYLVAPENQLSTYGRTVLKLLSDSVKRLSEINGSCITLSSAHLQGLTTLLTSCQCVELEDFLLQVLSREPGSSKLIRADVLLHCIHRESPSARDIGAVLLQNCSTHVLSFDLWCLDPSNLPQISSQNNSFLFLLNTYLKRATIADPTRPEDIQNSALKTLKKALMNELWHSVEKGEDGVTTGLQVEVLSNLIRLAAVNSDLIQLVKDLPAILQKPDTCERWKLADSISEKLCDRSEELCPWRKTLLSAALRWLTAVYKEQKDPQSHHEEAMLTRLKSLLIFPENMTASDWNAFVKSGLKYRYSDLHFLETLNTLLEIIYGTSAAPKELLDMATIHMMTTSHSRFLPTMLDTQSDPDYLHLSKESLVSLLLTLVRKCPEVCNSNHFLVLLGAYGASLSTTDQKLLLVLQEYEKNNISLAEFQYVLWGPNAVEHHKARKSIGPSLWQKPSSEQLLSLLTADRMLNTITHFPQRRYIIPQVNKNMIYSPEGNLSVELSSLYDPGFLLPLFSFILRPECAVDCLKFVSSHALGVTVAALSSYDPKVRAAAYQVLGSFYQHLEGARFREKRQLLYLLDTVKNGIQKLNLRITFVHVAYICKVAQQILRPEEHMYMVVSKFLLQTQFLNLKRVPYFFRLFYSFDLEHKLEREWMLSVLEDSVWDQNCYELCEVQDIYQTLLAFASTSLCDQACQIQIMNVLRQTVHVNKAAYVLTKEHGVLTWILQLIERRHVDSKLLSSFIELLHALWFTNLGDKESKAEAGSSTSGKCLPLPIINEFLCTLLTVIRHLRSAVSAAKLKQFLHTLSSVLIHCGTALNAHKDAGWLTLYPHKLSCCEVLSLLQRWAILSHDASLLSALQILGNKHQVKELIGSGREKGQGKCHSAKHAPFRMEKLTKADGKEEELELAVLDECKPLLRNILMHWEPKQKEVSISKSEALTTDKPESTEDATTCLILKWALKTLLEIPYDDESILALLKWISGIVFPHRSVADAMMSDESMRKDLLRLYHLTCQERSSTLNTLQLFSRIMAHLLKAYRGLNTIHQTLLRTCLLTNTDDDAKKETGLKLLSLHLYELWSEAQSPDLLLTHARLICNRTSSKKQKSPTLRICKDILAALES